LGQLLIFSLPAVFIVAATQLEKKVILPSGDKEGETNEYFGSAFLGGIVFVYGIVIQVTFQDDKITAGLQSCLW
jgi:hypothetical protein